MKALKVSLIVFGAVLGVILVAGLGIVYTGVFNIAADNPHWGITSRLIEATRERSIAVRARSVAAPPSLEDAQLIAMGAEHYAEMCTGCHLVWRLIAAPDSATGLIVPGMPRGSPGMESAERESYTALALQPSGATRPFTQYER